MTPNILKQTRRLLGLTQAELAEQLRTTRTTVAHYECGERRISGMIEVALEQLTSPPRLPMASIVAAGEPIEPIPQVDHVEVPPSMVRGGENFALRVKGESMRDEGILPGIS